MKKKDFKTRLFDLKNRIAFEKLALEVFRFQYEQVPVYRQFCRLLDCDVQQVSTLEEIPFLPIQFFKSHKILKKGAPVEEVFTSSGTTGKQTSKHFVHALSLYESSFLKGFEEFYGKPEDYVVLALLPSYLERQGSSLIYMANAFIEKSTHPESGFYLKDYKGLSEKLKKLDAKGEKVLLIGVSFALLALVEQASFQLRNTIIMETGGMKGRRKEMTRKELHHRLSRGFGLEKIHSEYGMTELLSQAYSQGEGVFKSPSTMSVLIREPEDPCTFLSQGRSGGLNIVDLANVYSCSFIATQDLGRKHSDGSFEILGRFDNSDLRGCNLMVL